MVSLSNVHACSSTPNGYRTANLKAHIASRPIIIYYTTWLNIAFDVSMQSFMEMSFEGLLNHVLSLLDHHLSGVFQGHRLFLLIRKLYTGNMTHVSTCAWKLHFLETELFTHYLLFASSAYNLSFCKKKEKNLLIYNCI